MSGLCRIATDLVKNSLTSLRNLPPSNVKSLKESIRTFVILSLIGGGDDWFNTVAISKDDLDDTKRDSLEGRPVYQFSGDVPERISLYDGLSQEQFQKHC